MGKFEARDEEIGADDYRAYFDSSCFRVWHLSGKERTYKITRVTRLTSEMVTAGKREIKKQPKLELVTQKGEPVPLPFLLNKTNAATIAQMYGTKTSDWVGKLITMYPTTTSVGGKEQDCIRIRPRIPAAKTRATEPVAPNGHDREPAHDIMNPDAEPPPGALESDRVQ